MRSRAVLASTFTLALSLPAAGCLMKHVETDPPPPLDLPEGSEVEYDPGRWWETFGDEELTKLVETALEDNFQMRQVWARWKQARALERAAAAGLFPNIGANAAAGRSQSPPRVFNLGGDEREIPGVEANSFSTSLPVSYELDVWGRVRAGMLAAEQDVVAARADAEALAMTVTANVTERWFDVLEQRALRNLIDEQGQVNQTNLRLVELRFQQGDAALSDVFLQQQQVQTLDAQRFGVNGQAQVAEQQLASLVGRSPTSMVSEERFQLPEPPPLPPEGIPASLLERRPDVRAAKARVVAADYRVAQAIAARLPSLTLSGSIGFSAVNLADFFEAFVWSITGNVAATVWDGGRLDAEIERSRAILEERVAAYGQALVTALVEVEGALTQERAGRARLATLSKQVDTAQKGFDVARRRFAAGVGNYLSVLTALRSLQQAQQTLLSTRRQLLSQRVQVYRALGSDWTRDLEPYEPEEDDSEDEEEAEEGT